MANVGINLAAVNYWGTEYPFIDRMKSAGGWTAVSSTGSARLTTDGLNDYPATMPSGASYIYTMIAVDPVNLAMTDRYVLTYKGTANIIPFGAKIISSEPGRIVFEATKDTVQLKVTGLSSSSPLGDMSVVREDQVSLFAGGEVFNPDFISKIDTFSTLRFMDWGQTNGSTLTSWAERPLVSDRSWAGSEGGVPIETMVALANKTHNDMWINIPAQADDGYVRATLQYVKANLDPGLKIKVEYSNEVWNFDFAQSKYAMAQGDKLFGTDANGDGKIDVNDVKEHVGDGYLQFYGYRAAQIASIANAVFGSESDARVENVLATNSVFAVSSILKGVSKAGVGSVTNLFDDYSTASYFASFGAGTSADIVTLLSWARSGAAGIEAAINEIAHGGALSKTMTVEAAAARLKSHGETASALGLDFVIYEGGPAMTAVRADPADQAELIAFYDRLLDDPRIGTLYKQVVAGFAAAGGVEFNAFNDAGNASSKYGVWGALDNIYEAGSVRYDTLVDLAKQGPNTLAPAATRTTAAAYALTPTQANMTYVGDGHTTLTGNGLSNRLVAGDRGSILYGLGGDDNLFGGAGNDLLDGGAGADGMTGGAGNDVYIVDNVGDKVIELANGGLDEVRTSLDRYNLGSHIENLTYTGVLNFSGRGNDLNNIIVGGSGDDTLVGGLGNDTLLGREGNDALNGGDGIDKMVGGRGDDTYDVDNAGDTIIELAGEGYDTVSTSVSFSLAGQSLESLRAKGNAAINLTGNELDNWIVGNDAANTIRGGAGADTLKGFGGADKMYGDAGDDLMYGGAGNDSLYGGDGDDRLLGEASNDLLDGGSGNDVLNGGDGDDILIGGPGRDLMTGGAGNDRFVFRTMSDFGKTRATADVIYDFAAGDKIDLSVIDAGRNTAVNDAFAFIGSASFTKHAGELRVSKSGSAWDIAGDVDGDGVADFIITANKAAAFLAADFIL